MSSDCPPNRIEWIYAAFGECVVTARDQASFWIGLSSTVIWMYAQIPQIIMNFKTKNVDGLSFPFLCFLVLGDLCNLVGAIITHGLITQIITATWFISVDVFCTLQYIVFKWLIPCIRRKKDEEDLQKAIQNDNGTYLLFKATPLLLASAYSASSDPYKPPALYGTILGWCSAFSYISSRTPQIFRNCKRRRTDGLSCQFFISAILGNSTYCISIFLKDYHWPYIWKQFPWIVGSGGILFFDFTVLFQFFCFRKNSTVDELLSTYSDSNYPDSLQ